MTRKREDRMRARGIVLLAIASLYLGGARAAQGQVDSPVGEARVTGSDETPRAASKAYGPGFRVVEKPIPFEVRYEFSRTVGPGRLVTVRKGQPGKLVKVYDGKKLVETKRVEPVDQMVHMGRSGATASRHSFVRGKVMSMEASAYDPTAGRGKGATFRTSTGLRAQFGVVAVDPRVIPMGTKLFVEGYGFAVAADKGSAIKGNRIDLCYNTYGECIRFGRKTVKVHVLR